MFSEKIHSKNQAVTGSIPLQKSWSPETNKIFSHVEENPYPLLLKPCLSKDAYYISEKYKKEKFHCDI